MAFNYSPKIVTDGLVLYLDAANIKSYVSGSTVWNDISRSGINGTLTNGPTFDSANGGSIVFEGVNDYILAPNISSPVGVSDFSIECWVNLSSLPLSNPRIVTLGSDFDNYFNLATYGGNSPGTYDIFWFEVKKGGTFYGGFFNVNASRKYVTDKWYHLVGTFVNSSNLPSFYINGESVSGSGVIGGAPNVFNTLLIGNNSTVSPITFNGLIQQVKYYNRALSSQQVLQNYNATKTRFGL